MGFLPVFHSVPVAMPLCMHQNQSSVSSIDTVPQSFSVYCIIFLLFRSLLRNDKLQLWPLHRIQKLYYSFVLPEISLTSVPGHIFVGGIFLY